MAERTVIKNAKIWTSNKDMPWAEALVAEGKDIVYVGSAKGAAPYFKEGAKVVDAGGKMVIPAFIDSHTHLTSVAKNKWCFLLDQEHHHCMEDILGTIRQYAEKTPREDCPYIYAYSCATEYMDQAHVNRYLVDQYVSDRPVLLCDSNFHRCLVNSKMLELMEIDENTPFHEDSSANYARDEHGVPNGFIYEHAYEFYKDIDKMFEKLHWWPPSEYDPDVVLPVLEDYTDWGVCGFCDGFTESEGTLESIKKLEMSGKLHHYYFGMVLFHKFSELEAAIETAKEWQSRYGDEYITIDTLKFFLDGTNEIGTSAVLEPFSNDPKGENRGTINMEEEDLTEVFQRLNQEGLNIQIHLVGDRSFRVALNAAERAQKKERKAGREFVSRIWLIHCELTKPEDRKRVAELGIIINFTPIWAAGAFGDDAATYLGRERADSMYAFREIIDSGAIVNFSSDVVDNEDFASGAPLIGIEAAHTRIMPGAKGKDRKVRKPASETLTIEELLLGYTINNAIALGIPEKAGSLEAGKRANLCILSQNIFQVPAYEISQTKIDLVMFENNIIRRSHACDDTFAD